MTAKYIRAKVAAYLRYERQYPIIAFERGFDYHSRPDILAVTTARFLVEVEVKTSLADFRNDAKKYKWRLYESSSRYHREQRPRQFYFAVPGKLKEKVLKELPEGAGLLEVTDTPGLACKVWAVRKAPVNRNAKRLSLRDLIKMVRSQTGTMVTLALKEAKQ